MTTATAAPLTVKDLVDRLKSIPDDYPVVVYDSDFGRTEVMDVFVGNGPDGKKQLELLTVLP